MKKKTITLALFAVLSTLSTSCQKENYFDEDTGIYTCVAIK